MYTIDELKLKDSSDEEQARTRTIFENIKERANNKELISEHEKEFFCMGVRLSKIEEDGKIEDYSCCDNYKFGHLYLSYFHDLSGNGNYEKIRGVEIYKVGVLEKRRDIEYLSKIASRWEAVIKETNHNEEVLKQISKETRSELRELDKNKGSLIHRKAKERHALNKKRILLQSKYIYIKSLLFFERFQDDDLILELNSQIIEINEYSIIHILSRHFSEITKQNPNKSYHKEDIDPSFLNIQLKEIIEKIDETKFLDGKEINSVYFKYKGTIYVIWINKRIKQIAGQGNVSYNRLETFYPVGNQVDIESLRIEYTYHQINDDIGVYVKK